MVRLLLLSLVSFLFAHATSAKPLPVQKLLRRSAALQATVAPTPVASVSVTLTHISGVPMAVQASQERNLDAGGDRNVEMVTYSTTRPYPSGTQYKVAVQTDGATYLYVVSSDDVNRTTRLFPAKSANADGGLGSPLVAGQSPLSLPADDRSFTITNQPGNTYLLVLVADKALDIDAVVASLRAAPGDFKKKVYTTLSRELIAPTYIRYDAATASFKAISSPSGSVAPLLVTVQHP